MRSFRAIRSELGRVVAVGRRKEKVEGEVVSVTLHFKEGGFEIFSRF
jgi:hypothetical protein